MPRAVSVFSDNIITDDGLESVMRRLQAQVDELGGWRLVRNGRLVRVVLGTDDLELMPDEMLERAERNLGAAPRSRVSLFFTDDAEDRFEFRMARAVAKAMAEIWNVSLDDHAGRAERINPPGSGRSGGSFPGAKG